MPPTDAELIDAFRDGDDEALGKLLAAHAPRIYRFGLSMCRDPEDAKDVLQETLWSAAKNLRDFRGESSLSTWLYTIARRFCIKKRRAPKDAPDETLSLDSAPATALPSPVAAPDEQAAQHELASALEAAIGALEPDYREIVILRDVEGLSAKEVAAISGLSIEAVKSRLHRARASVRARVAPLLSGADTLDSAKQASGCPDVVELFSRHAEGDIGQAECVAMQAHLDTCPRCTAVCDSLKQTLALCRAEPPGNLSPEVQTLVRDALAAFARGTR